MRTIRAATSDALREVSLGVSAFETFADACDRTLSPDAAGRVFLGTARAHGFSKAMLATHVRAEATASFSIAVHNFGPDAEFALEASSGAHRNPVFEAASASKGPVFWDELLKARSIDDKDRAWFERIARAGVEHGVTQCCHGALVPVSCSLAPARKGDPNIARVMLMAVYTVHQMLALQRPKLTQADLLTQREHECLSLAILYGLRPREVARHLGVSVNTVRTMRQSALNRLGARNQEEAVWRMLETGQLFVRVRLTRR